MKNTNNDNCQLTDRDKIYNKKRDNVINFPKVNKRKNIKNKDIKILDKNDRIR